MFKLDFDERDLRSLRVFCYSFNDLERFAQVVRGHSAIALLAVCNSLLIGNILLQYNL